MTYSSVSSTVVDAAGIAQLQYAVNDVNGIPEGITGAISNGSDAGMGIYVGVKKGGGPPAAPRIVNNTGNNGRFLHTYTFRPASLGELDLSFAVFSDNAYAAFTGTKIDSTNAEWNMVGGETDTPANSHQICILENIDAQDANATTDGQPRFLNWLYPAVIVYPLFATHDEAAPAEWGYKAIPTRAGKYPWGIPFSAAVNGFTKAARIKIDSVYPLTMHTFVGDGAKTSVVVNYSPASDATGYSIKAWDATAGVALTISSVVIATKTVTFSAAPTAGHIVIILYEAFDLLLG